MTRGILILDNNCYAEIEDGPAAERFAANVRIADLTPLPTHVNLLEATATPSDRVRERLLRTIERVRGEYPLLPWPFALLKLIGQAIVNRQPLLRLEATGFEWYLEDMKAARELSAEVLSFQQTIERTFTQFHATRRQQLQRRMKERGQISDFDSSADFLERVWVGSDTRREFAEATWEELGLPLPAPIDLIEKDEAWRLLLDAEGVGLFERAVASKQPKAVQRLDLIQLVYLAGAPRRVVASADAGFLRAAENILRGRYPNARAVHISDLLA